MKAVILAAGEGVRMRPLTLERPKPLIAVSGKPILAHIIEALPPEIDEIVVVVGYLGDQIANYCRGALPGRRFRFVWQKEKLGTARALELCQEHLAGDRFLMLYADDLHGADGIRRCLEHERSLLVAKHPEPQRFGVVVMDPDGSIREIVEKPANPPSNFVSTGVMVLDDAIFNYEPDLHPNGEYYLTSMANKMLRDYRVMAVETDRWLPIATPADLPAAEAFLRS